MQTVGERAGEGAPNSIVAWQDIFSYFLLEAICQILSFFLSKMFLKFMKFDGIFSEVDVCGLGRGNHLQRYS